MKKLILILVVLLAVAGEMQAQTNKRYGFTHTIRLRHVDTDTLLDAVQDWVFTNLPKNKFTFRAIDRNEGFITGAGTNTGDFGTVKYDLTFYVKNKVVDVVADNVIHSKEGRLPKEVRSKGTPKRKTKNYLTAISKELEHYLLQLPKQATVEIN